ncbi:MAG: hypothetical protein AAGC60_21335 [Acidobacteriota bacterium]
MVQARDLSAFLRLFDDEPPSFALVAYRGAPGMATAVIADTYGPAAVVEDATVRGSAVGGDGEDEGEPAALIAVVAEHESPWTVVLHSVGYVGADHLVALPDEALDLSETLGTDALVLSADAGSAGYELYRGGELLERATWNDEQGYSTFESQRGGSERDEVRDLAPAIALCRELGLHVPACCPRRSGRQSWLAAADPERIAHASLLDMAGNQLVGDEAIREASTDAYPRPTADMLRDDEPEERHPHASRLRGVLLRWVGRVLGE